MAKSSPKKNLDLTGLPAFFIDPVETYLNSKYEFRINPVLNRTEYKLKHDSNFKILDDRGLNSLFREIKSVSPRVTLTSLKALLFSDYVQEVDPFLHYFNSLPKWHSKLPDYIDKLASTVTTTNQEFWRDALKRWLVGSVACATRPREVNHHVLVLTGPQGIGKTTWLNNLLPPRLSGYLFSGTIHPNNKDTLIYLSENLFINLDELENLNKSELGSLKSLITQGHVRLRRSYAEFSENYVRRASFMGSVNDAEFLTDTTGNRRYLCFEVLDIQLDARIDMDKVYSQAFALLNSGFKHYFSRDEVTIIERNNSQFLRVPPEEELIGKYFEVPRNAEEAELMTPSEMMLYINREELTNVFQPVQNARKFGSVLRALGFQKMSKNGSKPYKVVRKDVESPKLEKDRKAPSRYISTLEN